MVADNAEIDAGACVWPSTLRKVITTALADAERAGMTGQTRDEWVSIAILGSSEIPLGAHFPAEGGGPCPHCGTSVFPPAVPTTHTIDLDEFAAAYRAQADTETTVFPPSDGR